MESDYAQTPLVSIGLPVYNGEAFIAQSIESLLRQDLRDFELIVSDNASTDGTQGICSAYAATDPRIVYLRQHLNVGAVRNWNLVVEAARGRFFKWASANDYCASTLLSDCVDALQSDPSVVVCYGRTTLVSDSGDIIHEYAGDLLVMEDRPSVRFARVCRELRLNNAQCGVMRLDVLRRTAVERAYPGGDMALMSELALHGKFLLLPAALFYRRVGEKSTSRFLSQAELREFLDPGDASGRQSVALQRHWDYLSSIRRAPISMREKAACCVFVARSAYWARAQLVRELRDIALRKSRNT